MARVPTYDEFQVQDRALPGARQESIASPSLLGAAGENIKQMGDAAQAASSGAAIVAAKMQDRENADRIFAAETALKDDLIKFETEQRSKKGAAALADGGVTQQTEKWFDETAQKHAGILTNDVQRRLFAQSATKLRLSTVGAMSLHQANEARASVADSANASIVGSINLAAANANDWTVAESSAKDIRARVQVLADLNGHSPEWREAMTGEKLTLLHEQVIQQLVRTNPAAAKAYYQKYEKDIDGAKRAEIGKFADEAASTSVGDGVADAIWKSNGPKNSSDPVNIADMEEQLRTTLKGNDAAIDKGIKGLRERVQSYNAQRKSQSDALEASVNGLILGGKFSRSSPEFLQLSAKDPEAARKVLTFVENQAYTNEARAAAREQRLDAAESRKDRRLHRDTLDTTLRLSDPDKLVGMTRDEVVNLLPTLGATSTQALLAKWDLYSKNGAALSEAKLDNDQFNVFAVRAGLDPNSKNDDMKKRIVDVRNKAEAIIGHEQESKKRRLSRDEKDAILQKQIDDSVMQHNFFTRDKAVPVIALPAAEQEKAYVVVGPAQQEVKLSSIPATFRVQALRERKAAGLATTEQQLAELWLRRTGKFKDK